MTAATARAHGRASGCVGGQGLCPRHASGRPPQSPNSPGAPQGTGQSGNGSSAAGPTTTTTSTTTDHDHDHLHDHPQSNPANGSDAPEPGRVPAEMRSKRQAAVGGVRQPDPDRDDHDPGRDRGGVPVLHRRERAAVRPHLQHQRRRRERGRAGQERRCADRRGAGRAGADDHARARDQAVAASVRPTLALARDEPRPAARQTRATRCGWPPCSAASTWRSSPARERPRACPTAARSRSTPIRASTTTSRSSTSTPRSRRSGPRRSGACAPPWPSSATRWPGAAPSSTTRSTSLRQLIGPLQSLLRAGRRPKHPPLGLRQRAVGHDGRAGAGGAHDQLRC